MPAAPLVAELRRYLKLDDARFRMTGRMVQNDLILSPIGVLAAELDMPRDTLQKIASGRSKTLDERLADMIACGIGRPDIYDVECDQCH